MAHFFDAVSYAPLVTYELHPKETKTVGLWGGDFLGNDLTVVIDTDLIKIQEKKMRQNNCRFFELTALKIGQTNLRAFAGQIDFAFPIETSVTKKMFTPQGNLAIRKMIVTEALSHVGNSHYLWGAAGNRPGLSDGAHYRPSLVKIRPNSFNQREPWVRTAWTDIDGINTCAGFPKSDLSQLSGQSISDYLKAGKDEPGKNGLFPRIWKFQNKTKPIGASNDGIVWGQSCMGVRHFDCIGFVNYCVGRYWWNNAVDFQRDIPGLFDDPANCGCQIITDPDDILDADLVTHLGKTGKWEHIGMIYLDEKKQAYVVQAADSNLGITKGEAYVSGKWGRRIRLKDNMIKTPDKPKY